MKNKTSKLVVGNLIIFILIWGVYFYMIQNIKSVSAAFKETNQKIISASQKEDEASDIKKKVEANLQKGFKLDEFIVHPDQTADVVQKIEEFGPLTGTSITTQSVSSEVGNSLPNGADFLKIIFNIEGAKPDVLKAISLAENLPYNIKINKVSFAASTGTKWTSTVDMFIVKMKDTK